LKFSRKGKKFLCPVLLTLYKLIDSGVKLWLQNQNIKLFIPNGCSLTKQQRKFIKLNKAQIFDYLKNSEVYSKNYDFLIFKSEVNKIPLSFSQERLWFTEQYMHRSSSHTIPLAFKLVDDINIEILEASIKSIINRHEILRTLIKQDEEGDGYQLVAGNWESRFFIDKKSIVLSELEIELAKPLGYVYNLSEEYPIKVYIYEVSNNDVQNNLKYYLSVIIHHIAFDGWSIDIFLKELQVYYDYYLSKAKGIERALDLPHLSIQYKDFALWQRCYLTEKRITAQIHYWKNKLIDYQTLHLITDKPRLRTIDYKGATVRFEIEEVTSRDLRALAKELKVSLYSLLLSGYYLMLRVYSNQNDIVIGTPISNRHYGQVDNLIGVFINSLVIRLKIESNDLITRFISDTSKIIIEAHDNQDLPFEKLIESLNVDRDITRHPIFQVLFGFQSFGSSSNVKTNHSLTSNNLIKLLQKYKEKGISDDTSQFDFSTFIDDSQSCLKGKFNYAVNLYNEDTIMRFIATYTYILKQFSYLLSNQKKQMFMKVANLKYLTSEEYKKIVNTGIGEKVTVFHKPIHELFEEQAEKTPDNIAVTCKNITSTYRELNEKSNQLANMLKYTYNIQRNELVGLYFNRNESIIIAILAVLKAGGAYVPIAPNHPYPRIQYIVGNTNTRLILTNKLYTSKLKYLIRKDKASTVNILPIDNKKVQQKLKYESKIIRSAKVIGSDLIYVMYTSGTTGKPKGVMIEHKSFINTIYSIKDLYFSTKTISTYSLTDYVFDIFGLEYALPLMSGGMISIGEYEFSILDCAAYDFIQMTPSLCRLNLNCLVNTHNIKLFVGGENLKLDLLQKMLSKSITVVNFYGPTETTIWSTSKLYSPTEDMNLSYVSLGKPFNNERIYVLDRDMNHVPIGAIGELYIGGVGLARKYLNLSELTAESFIHNPFAENVEKRIYKTGDLVRWLPDGDLEYIGRNDFQVKIRGHRVELGEIETALYSYKGIKENVVVAKGYINKEGLSTENKYLIGYYVSESQRINEKSILTYLRTKLPEYMVPTKLVRLERFPLTDSGKLNRELLPNPELVINNHHVTPKNEVEHVLCKILSEVLDLAKENISTDEDFFSLGGNSIIAIKFITKINEYYRAKLKLSDLFVYKTVESLAILISQSKCNYQDIVKLNNTYHKTNMFMIHSGTGGCEVYASLAEALSDNFSCYGIDSYNLYHRNKIKNLHEISKRYLIHIDEIMTKTGQSTYHLLGWSLGGEIALEIAHILGQRGNNKIKTYILDSIIADNDLLKQMDAQYLKKKQQDYRNYAISRGYTTSYIRQVIANMEVVHEIRKSRIPIKISNTDVLLFKAMLSCDVSQSNAHGEYRIHSFPHTYNNINRILGDNSTIKLVKVNNMHHFNILDYEDLAGEIISWRNIDESRG